jgi:quercetin dioxygenase-like cupin family protein
MPYHVTNDQIPWQELGGGVRRKILAHTPDLMAVLVQFDKGAVGSPHSHEIHDQISYVVAGALECKVDGQKQVLRAGDVFVAPKHKIHGVVALEDKSALLDVFSPRRDDFLK